MQPAATLVPCGHCGDPHAVGVSTCPNTGQRVGTDGPCGKRVDRYDVIRLLGMGGMGAVYLARHTMLGHMVALKLLRSHLATDADVVTRFLREAQAAAAIGHPHIVRVTDFGVSTQGQAFLAMELLEGVDLAALAKTAGALPLGRVADIVLQVLDALGAAHAAGIVHRDVKPANVFLDMKARGGADFVKLVDFGVSKIRKSAVVESFTRTGVVVGTPCYMAPEQFRGSRDADERADVYSCAVMLYELCTGAMPFQGDTYEELVIRVSTEPPTPIRSIAPDLPDSIAEIIEIGMARDPNARFRNAGAFANALRGAFAALSPERLALPGTMATAHTVSSAQIAHAMSLASQTPPPSGVSLAMPPSVSEWTPGLPSARHDAPWSAEPTPGPQHATPQLSHPPASAMGTSVRPNAPMHAPAVAAPTVASPAPGRGRGRTFAIVGGVAILVAVAATTGVFVTRREPGEASDSAQATASQPPTVASRAQTQAQPQTPSPPTAAPPTMPPGFAGMPGMQPGTDPTEWNPVQWAQFLRAVVQPNGGAGNTPPPVPGAPGMPAMPAAPATPGVPPGQMPVPVIFPRPAPPREEGTGVTLETVSEATGRDMPALRDAVERASGRLGECRVPGRAERATIQLLVNHDGSVGIAQPWLMTPGDRAVAQCVANRLAPISFGSATGATILRATFALAAR